ncbi:DUF5689 domain-containing protein [Flavobacterium facile]|uniref:DUF5689 domain-containing protein n=1 Tax=Flavobacterium facile TaxID=2893174 RepID=UPI002E773E70|nr:DUF5689 domain-containing protein [Flavobacterium sp. T-12]
MKNLKLILAASLFTTLFSCINNDNYSEPDLTGECADLTATKTIQDVALVATTTAQQWNSTTDSIIEAYVTSSDEGGNFYKSISMVSIDGTKGFSMPIDAYNLYTKYEPGRKVFINLNKRYYANNTQTASLDLGSLYAGTQVGRISGVEYEAAIKRSCTKVDENTLVNHLTIAAAKNNANTNKLVELDGVQFAEISVGKKYFDKSLNASPTWTATNHTLTDASGNSIIVRVSEFANFSSKNVATGNGKIRGILTKYNSDFQFMIRTENDVHLNGPRVDSSPPIVGSANVFDATLNEPFTSYALNLANFPKYINDADSGPRYWQVKSFGTPANKYIEMSSFAGATNPGVPAKTFFMVPVDFTAASTMTFKKEMRFYRGEVALKVYYIKSADYVAGSAVDRSKLTDITTGSGFNITYPAIGASENTFSSPGTYNIPVSLTGNGYFVFEYIGTTTQTTTVQIDDILIN